jgi:hypothetical protein
LKVKDRVNAFFEMSYMMIFATLFGVIQAVFCFFSVLYLRNVLQQSKYNNSQVGWVFQNSGNESIITFTFTSVILIVGGATIIFRSVLGAFLLAVGYLLAVISLFFANRLDYNSALLVGVASAFYMYAGMREARRLAAVASCTKNDGSDKSG